MTLLPCQPRVHSQHPQPGSGSSGPLSEAELRRIDAYWRAANYLMATRSGSVDPGLVLWLEEHVGMPPAELAATLEHRSGLLGLAGTADMREILARMEAGDPDASLAFDIYVPRLRAAIAAMAASMGGLDALVFTRRVGENAPTVRERACRDLAFLGVALDGDRNVRGRGDREIGAEASAVRSLAIAAREDLQMAHEVRTVLGA